MSRDKHPLDTLGFPAMDYFYHSAPSAMATDEFSAFDSSAQPPEEHWGHGPADPNAFGSMQLSPANETSPVFFGDYTDLSDPFTNSLGDGQPLPYFDAAAAAATVPAPTQWGGGLLSPQYSIASAVTDASLASCYEQPLAARPTHLQLPTFPPIHQQPASPQQRQGGMQVQGGRPAKTTAPSTTRKSKSTGRTGAAEASASKTRQQKHDKGDDAKSKTKSKGKSKPPPSKAASLPTPRPSLSSASGATAEGGGTGRSRGRKTTGPSTRSTRGGALHDDEDALTLAADEYDDDDEDDYDSGASEDEGDGGSRQPLTQRERNRKAATKCRAKTKATADRLASDEQAIADVREALSAEVTTLRQEALSLRLLVLQHHGCACAQLQAYIRNSAKVIGRSGGRAVLFGPDGHGCPADPGLLSAGPT